MSHSSREHPYRREASCGRGRPIPVSPLRPAILGATLLALGTTCTVSHGLTGDSGAHGPRRVVWARDLTDHGLMPPKAPLETCRPLVLPETRTLVVGSSTGELVATELDRWAPTWRVELGGGIRSEPVVAGDALFVGTDDGKLCKIGLSDGHVRWCQPTKGLVRGRALVSGGRVFFGTEPETFLALDAATGEWLWEKRRYVDAEFTVAGMASPVLAAGAVVVGYADGHLVALQPEDGSVRWELRLGSGDGVRTFPDVDHVVRVGERDVIAASFSGGVYRVSATDGHISWHEPEITSVSALTIDPGIGILVGTGDGELYALDPDSGSISWRLSIHGGDVGGAISHGPYLVVASRELGLLFFDSSDKTLVARFAPSGGASMVPSRWKDRLFFLSDGGFLYSIEAD